VKNTHHFLRWVAGRKPFDWHSVDSKVIFRYAMVLRGCELGMRGLNNRLSYLRQFLRFAHVRGLCGAAIAESVPRFSKRGRALHGAAAEQWELRAFLNAFKPRSPLMARDYAMALCMLDLGLRCIEVVRLRLADINWKNKTLNVPPAKGGGGCVLPMPARVASALRDYLRVRPASGSDACFVGITFLAGRPVACTTVNAAIVSACRRCGLGYRGTHWLRRSSATRLNRHGVGLKQIADLLGHRLLKTTAIYTHANTRDLEALVRPWPR
jgi:site-specific recombinase XerD